jgi:release factor glutamine methyltransferase
LPSLLDVVGHAAQRLEHAGIRGNEAALDAELLARHLLGFDRARWLLQRSETATADFLARYDAAIDRRLLREPIAYIIGHQEFWGREFAVSPDVLIPRPETELLVERALGLLPPGNESRIIDIGTGSGCIAIALALERPAAVVHGTDTSAAAIDVARGNADRLGAANVRWSVGEYLAGEAPPFDLIASNPPYIGEHERADLMPEVLREPPTALFAGDAGLATVRSIMALARDTLVRGGHLLIEIGWQQAGATAASVSAIPGLRLIDIAPDLQGIPRVAVIERVGG